MKVSSERLENCEVMLTIEVDEERVGKALQAAARRIAQQTNIPGFRRGKAPFPIVLQMFGRPALLEEAMEDLGQQAFTYALEETKVEPFAQAEMEDVQLDPLVFKMKVPVAPTIDLGEYRKLRLDPPAVELTDEEVQQALERLREGYALWVPVEREAEWGDQITAKISIKDVATDDQEDSEDSQESPEPYDVHLSEDGFQPMPGFREEIIGIGAGEDRQFELAFPEDYSDETLRGQTRAFDVQALEVKRKELPEWEELPAMVGDYADLDALKEELLQSILSQKTRQAEDELISKAMDILVEQATIEYPNVLLEEEMDSLMLRQESSLRSQRLSMENYLKVLKLDREEYREQLRPDAEVSLKRSLILGKLAELEGLRVDEEEIRSEIEDRSSQFDSESATKMREALNAPSGLRYVATNVLTGKVYDRLTAIVQGEAPDLPPSEETDSPTEAATEEDSEGETPEAETEPVTESEDEEPSPTALPSEH